MMVVAGGLARAKCEGRQWGERINCQGKGPFERRGDRMRWKEEKEMAMSESNLFHRLLNLVIREYFEAFLYVFLYLCM